MTSTEHTDQPLTTSTKAPARRVRKAIAAALAILSLAGAGVALTTSTASAAADAQVRFCTNSKVDAYLYRYNFDIRDWEYAGRKGTNNASGCGTFSRVESGYYYVVRGHRSLGGAGCPVLDGFSSYSWTGSGQVANVGTFSVNTYWLC
jgi:hypothetical protein